jgi:sugar phosphate isomerase/epimerase
LWSTNRNYFEEAKRLTGEGQCDYIELYAFPKSFDEFAQLWKSIDIPYVIHAPHSAHGMNLANAQCSESNIVLAKEAFDFANLLNASHVIFHPGIAGDINETIKQIKNMSTKWKQKILIENKPYRTITDPPLTCNGHSPEQIKQVISETGVGFCLDIGHAIYAANDCLKNQFDFISDFQKLQPRMYHLSDGYINGVDDVHLNIGNGDFNFGEILKNIAGDSRISLETEKKSSANLDDFVTDVRNIKKMINKKC